MGRDFSVMLGAQTLRLFAERVRNSEIFTKIKQGVIAVFPLAALAIITFLPYFQTSRFDFLNFDDSDYVFENAFIHHGLNWQAIRWAFTSNYASNWHPLTWLAYIIQYQNVGADPAYFHLLNVAFHLLNTLLLFLIFKSATGSTVKSFLMGVLFAIHPMHVQSVAWIAELKDVLSTFWGLLSLLYYQKWALSSERSSYRRSLLFFVFSLLSKQTLVTFPVILLLFDFWPLGRTQRFKFSFLVREKIPYFVISFAAALLTFWAQSKGGAVQTFQAFSFNVRMLNSISAYVDYISKLFFPVHLSIYYPYVHNIPWAKTLFSAISLVTISFLAVLLRRKKPYFFFGWFFYLISLLPVIGIIQIGSQAIADRYTYIPYTGLFIIIVFLADDFLRRSKIFRIAGCMIFLAMVFFLSRLTFAEVGYWKNSTTLFQRNIEVNPKNYLAQYQLGLALNDAGKVEEAKPHVQLAVALLPKEERFHNLMALIWLHERNYTEAKKEFHEALRLEPFNPEVYNNLGGMYLDMKEYDLSFENFKKSIEQKPDAPSTYVGLMNCAKDSCNFEAIAGLLPRMEALRSSNPQIKSFLDWLESFKGKTLSEIGQACKEQAEVRELIDLVQRVKAVQDTPKVVKEYKVQKVFRLPTQQ